MCNGPIRSAAERGAGLIACAFVIAATQCAECPIGGYVRGQSSFGANAEVERADMFEMPLALHKLVHYGWRLQTPVTNALTYRETQLSVLDEARDKLLSCLDLSRKSHWSVRASCGSGRYGSSISHLRGPSANLFIFSINKTRGRRGGRAAAPPAAARAHKPATLAFSC
ncbi:hypothetical protein EVAR_57258_1 [Eumeta japonica]|uniref:Uncharacterized protein n=1 Tax=Eumeta variegata TaxID=151549 RepID=A0A4C1ZTI2_EUMVA|nr:hypothetical protein EVAR_57258_1 [Eumeta japonica]